MAHKKSGGSTTIHTTRPGKRLGTKLYTGDKTDIGGIIVRQRGTKIGAGKNVGVGKDHTLYSLKKGTVAFKQKAGKTVAFVE